MSMSHRESLAQYMKKEEKEVVEVVEEEEEVEVEVEEVEEEEEEEVEVEVVEQEERACRMKKCSEDKEVENLEKKKKRKKKEHQSRSVTFYSPTAPPYTSDSDSSVSDGVLPDVVANHVVQMANRFVQTVLDPIKVEEGTDGENNGESDSLMYKKEAKLYKTLLWIRIAAFVLCLKALAVMAAAKQTVLYKYPVKFYYVEIPEAFLWYNYIEFKYSMSVNVMGFVYSGIQICDLVKYLITKKHTVDPKLRCYFNFAMDQVLAYLLISASTSAATRVHDLKTYEGIYKFIALANASVAMSFLAFWDFALATIVSGFFILSRLS
ncbi:CASP-like protein N24 [Gastrolobium bilobum]|uniref:CASP-like protein N24 n=1 Tax=Gastrolobium bilobum TaxID=150636 RepID=UPI002AB2CDFD|nr:CASP-like protein N24 [Gastrolobium bilobum]